VIALALAVLTAMAGVAAATTPAQDLEKARELFRARDFAGAIPQLNYLLYPQPRLSQTEDLVEAHVLLAVCAFENGDRKTARREFEEALFLQRDVELDTLLFSNAAVDFFDDVKKQLEERDARDAEQRALAEENERLQARLKAMIVVETHPYYINFIPFGAGQFQNGEKGKALFFAVSEAVTGGASAGLFLYLYGQYGFGATVTTPEARAALPLQRIEVAAGATCIGLMIWGVIDSLVHYQPSVRREPDKSLLDLDKPLPSVTPTEGGATLSLTWEL
jgi:hypothetical protein